MKLIPKIFIGFLVSLLLVESLVRLTAPIMGPPLKSWNTMQDAKLFKLRKSNSFQKDGIFVLGNSTALFGINPSVISRVSQKELEVFNAAMSGSSLQNMKDFALNYIIPEQKPKAVVLFLAPGTLDKSTEAELSLNPLSSSLLPDSFRNWLGKELYLFEYRNNLRNPMTLNSFKKSILTGKTGFGIVESWADDLDRFGYSVLGNSDESIGGGWSLKDIDRKMKYTGQLMKTDIKALKELIGMGKQYGTQIVVSTVPLPSLNASYRLQVQALASSLNIPFISGNDALTSGDYFADEIHLNSKGAKVFSKFIARELLKMQL